MESSIDYKSLIRMDGRVRAGQSERSSVPISNAKVSLYDRIRAAEVPVDFTNFQGEFRVNDSFYWGCTIEMEEGYSVEEISKRLFELGNIISGTDEIDLCLKVERDGYETAFFDLEPYYVKEEQIYCSTAPIEIRMSLLKREETEE